MAALRNCFTRISPGAIRDNTFHQGDLDGIKGLYHVNAVDEVTQMRVIVSAERISERYLIPALDRQLKTFPFIIRGFHADNGNALVESRNGSVVRKHLGYDHIPRHYAQQVNHFTVNSLSPCLNFHRPCLRGHLPDSFRLISGLESTDMLQSVNLERVQLADTTWSMVLYIRMNTFRYTASARLGVWDSVPHKRDEFLNALAKILQDNSHAVLESSHEFIPTDNPSLASITAICDKIIARGNPTLVDFDFERTLLNGPCEQYLNIEELGEEEKAVGFKFSGMKVPGKRDALLKATQDLPLLPYRNETGSTIGIREMPPEFRDSTSVEEDLFLDQFKTVFGEYLSIKLHRQVLIRELRPDDNLERQVLNRELVDQPDNNLEQSRVDFVFQSGPVRWVFEVDGQQHNEPGQHHLDKQRDTLLEQYGWTVHRVPAGDVREKHTALLEQLKDENVHILNPTEHDSVQTITARSGVHAAAFNSILLPLAVQRCLRGLLLLYLHEVLDAAHQQRVLIIEEDCAVATEAFRILCSIWEKIHILAPDTSPPPKLKLDVIGGNPDLSTADTVRYLDAPDGSYDLILSHSFLLDTGCVGSIEKAHFPIRPKNYVCLRHAIGFRGERSLQWCKSLRYDLADVEQATISRSGDNPEPMPPEKHKALIFFLKHIFRKRDFRDGQLRVIARLLQGKASIVLLPTGGGKSLTYQFSGLLLPGMTIVIDPLVALMAD